MDLWHFLLIPEVRILTSFQDLQLRPQSQRHEILELLHDLMFNHRPALKELENEFVIGMTDLVSGEKDPRNLMIIFSMLKAVMVEWDISGYTEVSYFFIFCKFLLTSSAGIRLCLLLLSHHFPSAT